MVFSSQTFLFVFFPLTLLLYALARPRMRNLVLLGASMLFYLWGGGWFIGWLLVSIIGNWLLGMLAASTRGAGDTRKLRRIIIGSVIFNIGILGWFKYANFFVDQLNAVGSTLGYNELAWATIMLPIGISFFTFQANSYVFDIAKGDASPMRNPLDFALYVSLFPQLIAGPIVRYHEIASQLVQRTFTLDNISAGMTRFTHGLCKKVLIADSVAPIAEAAFAGGASTTTAGAWIGITAYTIQIYFDFSGYSDMAIGLGRVFGFRFPENFKHPYSSASMTEFWRRWHVTLSSWFRDYVYFPLGGSRGSRLLTYRNLILVFLLTGFWHGANWTFIIWGVYHGFWLIVDRLTGRSDEPRPLPILLIKRSLTLLLVMLGWVIFRADTLTDAINYYQSMIGLAQPGGKPAKIISMMDAQMLGALVLGALIFFAPRTPALGMIVEESTSRRAAVLRLALVLIALPMALILILGGTFSPFLYFQF